ncbi:D-galactose 1-dehydrogenase/L-arabinose 1-dehydrogenase [Albimonas pacifica]|uniref:D-galactose 1-dehydrogenase/L-arabinose 1-dehydrogenase n=2 Tax=Albimonas pacifica TaxID=1114924 RepID=A0A1I3BM62_9RHOB|nr:Gfo/Idh/MocA family oxidoreductase [Albimonas pacifica]SFH63424.1 D-galactose 1-dehydrogenase/L-arabinose 1-dehydrogenase [Albimonas pacifica]
MTRADAIDLALVGVGKIARDQHLPAIAADAGFRLAATASRSGGVEGVENHAELDALLAARPDVAAVSLCQPPQARYEAARAALLARRHVMLEKPPGQTVAEVQALADLAAAQGVTLFATWHSRHAAGVAPARDWLASRPARRVRITWQEDVREWHPGQTWIWQAGGLGVFDPGINALSILTAILPGPVRLTAADLHVPTNCETPIACDLVFAGAEGLSVEARFDFRWEGPPRWDIEVETDAGLLRLAKGGAALELDGAPQRLEDPGEYPDLYRRFGELIAAGASDVDLAPLVLVADAFLLGRRLPAEPFHE